MSCKIKDCFFMGDINSAQDTDFLQLNGITNIINCAPRQVPNLFQHDGIQYTTCDLEEVLKRNFFDLRNREFLNLIKIIDSALQSTESVLVHSFDGLSRSPSVVMGYLMFKYCWGVDKAHEFLLSKKPEMKPHESYIEQLCLLETQLQASFQEKASEEQFYNWNPDTVDPNNSDEIVLLNTYLNYRATKGIFINNEENRCIKTQRLTWIDQHPEFTRVYSQTVLGKPERPPNHSYNSMSPGNGWVDLATPLATIKHEVQDVLSSTSISRPPSILASSKSTTLPKSSTVTSTLSPILSNLLISTTMNVQKKEMDTIVSKLDDTSLVFQEENSSPSFPEIGSEFSLRSKKNNDSINARATRFHSFSVPKRMLEVTSENNLMSTASTTLHEREDQEPIILLSRQKESKAQTSLPRYLQDTKSSSRYKKPNRSGSSSRTSRQGSSRTFENASKKELSGAVATNKIATKVKEITTMNAGLELAGLSESCNPKMAFNTFTTINSERPRTAPLSGGRSDDPPGIKLETLRVDTNSFGISHASLDTSLRMMSKSQAKGISIAPPRTTLQTQPRLIKTTWK